MPPELHSNHSLIQALPPGPQEFEPSSFEDENLWLEQTIQPFHSSKIGAHQLRVDQISFQILKVAPLKLILCFWFEPTCGRFALSPFKNIQENTPSSLPP